MPIFAWFFVSVMGITTPPLLTAGGENYKDGTIPIALSRMKVKFDNVYRLP